MANCAPTYEPIIILTAIIKPYTKSTWPKIIKRTNAPKLEENLRLSHYLLHSKIKSKHKQNK